MNVFNAVLSFVITLQVLHDIFKSWHIKSYKIKTTTLRIDDADRYIAITRLDDFNRKHCLWETFEALSHRSYCIVQAEAENNQLSISQ